MTRLGKQVVVEGTTLRLEAYGADGGRAQVVLKLAPSGERLAIDVVTPASRKAREELLKTIPEGHQEEAGRLLAELAERLAALPAGAGDGMQGGELRLVDPEPWPEPVDGGALMADLVALLHQYVVLPDGGDVTLALWVLFAHAHATAAVSPLLALVSPEKRCGKTTTLTLLERLVPRALSASNITTAALFRTVERFGPTLLVDEADTFLKENLELRGLLNSGHVRGAARVVRTVGEDFEPRSFSTWAPKVVALIGDLPATLEDRAIRVELCRRRPEERVDRLRLDRLNELERYQRMAARFVEDHVEDLGRLDPLVPDSLHDRAADNWRPLLALAELVGGAWPEVARRAAVLLSGGRDEGASAPAIQLLADIRELCQDADIDRLESAEIVRRLGELEDRPWSEWRRGRPITPAQLARLLRRFGIQPRGMRVGDRTPRGYYLDDFQDAFSRYLSPVLQHLQQPREDAGDEATETCNGIQPVAGAEVLAEPHDEGAVAPVAALDGLLDDAGWVDPANGPAPLAEVGAAGSTGGCEAVGEGAETAAAPPPGPCPDCHGARFWRHVSGGPWVCGTCHPPAGEEVIGGRWGFPDPAVDEDGVAGEASVPPLAAPALIDTLSCPDCGGGLVVWTFGRVCRDCHHRFPPAAPDGAGTPEGHGPEQTGESEDDV